MFRPLRRIKQQLSNEECITILENEVRGVLSVLGDNGYPYGLPINYYFSKDDINHYICDKNNIIEDNFILIDSEWIKLFKEKQVYKKEETDLYIKYIKVVKVTVCRICLGSRSRRVKRGKRSIRRSKNR